MPPQAAAASEGRGAQGERQRQQRGAARGAAPPAPQPFPKRTPPALTRSPPPSAAFTVYDEEVLRVTRLRIVDKRYASASSDDAVVRSARGALALGVASRNSARLAPRAPRPRPPAREGRPPAPASPPRVLGSPSSRPRRRPPQPARARVTLRSLPH